MNRTKRVVSCPNLSSKSSRTRDKELANSGILKKIQRQYELCAPRLLGHPLKLTDLFTSVIVRGGYRAVCDRRLWLEVADELNLPSSCTNSGVGLRCIYHRFLIKIELDEYPNLAKNYLSQLYSEFSSDPIEKELSFIPATSIDRNLGISHSDAFGNPSLHSSYRSLIDLRCSQNIQDIPRTYTPFDKSYSGAFDQSCDPDQSSVTTRSHLNDSLRLRDPTELVLAELALSSGLPNEVDSALNSLLILSTTPCTFTGASTSIRLPHCRNLLNLVLATIGIYTDGFGSFNICDPYWKNQTQLDFLRFWHNMVREPEGRVFLKPDVFINPDSDDGSCGSAPPALPQLFASPISTPALQYAGNEEAEAYRVLLVATLLVNLVTPSPFQSSKCFDDDLDDHEFDVSAPHSFPFELSPLPAWRENSHFLASSPAALRFAFLCSYAQHSALRQLGLQLLSSLRYPLNPPSSYSMCVTCPSEWTPLADFGCRLGDLTLTFINRCVLDSPDRASLIAGLHFLSNLATVPEKANEFSLTTGLRPVIWHRLAQLLCLPDLAVVCATLEVLRCLTNLGHYVCASAWQACLDTVNTVPVVLLRPLLALLTLEGQAMGSRSLHRSKVMPRSIRAVFPPVHPSVQQHPVPSGTVYSTEWSHTLPYPRNFPSGQYPPPVHSVSPHQQTDFSSRSMNAFPLRPRVSGAARLNKPLPNPVTTVEVTTTSVRSPGSSQRQLSNHSNCTGLINLLASPEPPSSAITSNSSVLSQGTTCTGASGSLPSCYSPNLPLLATTKTVGAHFSSPSLSELTDRLQMPPPSLPPPSALRRSAKSSLSRCSLTPGSPSRSCIPVSSSPATPTTTLSTPPATAVNEFATSPMKMGFNEIEKANCAASTGSPDISEPLKISTSQRHSDSPHNSVGQCDLRTTISHCNFPSGFCRSSKVEGKVPSPNGSVTASCRENKIETASEYSHAKRNDALSPIHPYVNGLRPGILQAAVDALGESKLDKLSKFANAQEGLVNGFLIESSDCGNVLKAKMDIDPSLSKSRNCVGSTRQMYLNCGKKSLPVSQMNGHAEDNWSVAQCTCVAASPTISSHKYSGSSVTNLTNGTSDNSDSGSSNESGGNCSPPASLQDSPTSHNRFLKRRRKWGSRSRLFNPKRRRSQVVSDSQVDTCIDSVPQMLVDRGNPLKPPLQPGTLPDSVLSPTWKSPWSSVSQTGTETHNITSSNSGQGIESNLLSHGPSDPVPVSIPNISKVPTQEHFSHKYICEWESCHATFKMKDDVALHVYHVHLAVLSRTTKDGNRAVRHCCHWRNCMSSSLARAPFALLTHVLDVHCNPGELETRKRTIPSLSLASTTCDVYQEGKMSTWNPSGTSVANSQHTNNSVHPMNPIAQPSSDQSAWSIVRSMEMRQMQMDMWAAHYHFVSANPTSRLPFVAPSHPLLSPPPREGPVTKHLRVTAALILRNFVLYLNEARNWFATELPLLSEISLGCSPSDNGLKTNDSGSIIAQCFALCSLDGSPTQTAMPYPTTHTTTPNYSQPFTPVLPRHSLSSDQHRRRISIESQSLIHTVDLDAKYA